MNLARILIVDDSEDDVLLASAVIRRGMRNARFQRVDSAVELDRALSEQTWDLVLCDHNMPCFDSAAALAQVRRADVRVPFFVYSGAFDHARTAAAIKAGANGVLEKRDIDGLLRVIGAALGSSVSAATPCPA